MAGFDGSGQFTRSFDFTDDRDAGVKIQASRMDEELDGIATGLSTCILKDGTQTITANIPMNTKKFTGLAAGSASGDSVRYEQVVLLSAAANQTITRTAAGTVLTLESTDAGATSGPDLVLHRNSASPADNDVLGGIKFQGEDDASNATDYGRIVVTALDVTDGTEDGYMDFRTMVAGTETVVASTSSGNFSIANNATVGGTLGVTGAATLSSTLAVTGAITGSSTLSIGTSNALTAGTIELGHASDTTLSRLAAGKVGVEGVALIRENAADAASLLDAVTTQLSGDAALVAADRIMVRDGGIWKWMTVSNFIQSLLTVILNEGLINSTATVDRSVIWDDSTSRWGAVALNTGGRTFN